MKSQTSNFKSQSGATIIVAVVLLATIGFISFSVSTVLLRSIRTSRALQDTELALAGANSGIEVGLFRFQRSVGGIGITDQALSNGSSFSVTPDLTDDPLTFTISGSETLYVGLYNPENIDITDAGYRSIIITNFAGSNTLRLVEVVPWSEGDDSVCNDPSIPAGTTETCNLGADRYQMVLQVNGGGTASGTIRAFTGSSGSGSPKGIPSPNPMLDITGKMSDVQRRIRIDLINP